MHDKRGKGGEGRGGEGSRERMKREASFWAILSQSGVVGQSTQKLPALKQKLSFFCPGRFIQLTERLTIAQASYQVAPTVQVTFF